MEDNVKMKYLPKKLVNILLGLVILLIVGGLVADFIIFRMIVIEILFACFAYVFIFIVLIILFIFSFILVFGFSLFESHGFWPIDGASKVFNAILSSIHMTENDVDAFRLLRIVLLVICSLLFIYSLIVLIINKNFKTDENLLLYKQTKNKIIISIVLLILEIILCVAIILLIKATI